jgi:hypothetical protein
MESLWIDWQTDAELDKIDSSIDDDPAARTITGVAAESCGEQIEGYEITPVDEITSVVRRDDGQRVCEVSRLPSDRWQVTSPWTHHTHASVEEAIEAVR